METKHTPGPWRVDVWKYSMATPPRECPTIVAEKDAIAEVFALWCPDDREAERIANAHLIAAAPELLAALEGLLAEMDSYQYGKPWPGRPHAKCDAALRAIAKAKARPQN